MPKPRMARRQSQNTDALGKSATAKTKTSVTSISITTKPRRKLGAKPKTIVVIKNTTTTTSTAKPKGGSIDQGRANRTDLNSAAHLRGPKRVGGTLAIEGPAKRMRRDEKGSPVSLLKKPAVPCNVRGKPFISTASPDILSRLERALQQRLYLIRHERHGDGLGARFAVLGNTGNVYEVNLGLLPTCTCVDFVMKKKPCKHLLFVWLRVLKKRTSNPLVWQQALVASEVKSAVDPLFSSSKRTLPTADKKVLCAFGRTLSSSPPRGRRKNVGEDCPICFEATTAKDEKSGLLTFCQSCGINGHAECIQLWRKASSRTVLAGTCPVCRGQMGTGMGSSKIAPGALLPIPVTSRWGVGGAGRGYLNLRAHSGAHTSGSKLEIARTKLASAKAMRAQGKHGK